METWKHLRAILPLPGIVTLPNPATILYLTGIRWPPFPWNIVLAVIGCGFVLVGLGLIVWTNRLFTTVGRGS